mgnify:CR=1 FL=1
MLERVLQSELHDTGIQRAADLAEDRIGGDREVRCARVGGGSCRDGTVLVRAGGKRTVETIRQDRKSTV